MSYHHYYAGHGIAHMIVSAVIHAVIWATIWKIVRHLGIEDSIMLAVAVIGAVGLSLWVFQRLKST